MPPERYKPSVHFFYSAHESVVFGVGKPASAQQSSQIGMWGGLSLNGSYYKLLELGVVVRPVSWAEVHIV